MSIPVVYDTMVFLQQASRPERTHASFRAVEEGRVILSLSSELLAKLQDVLAGPALRVAFPALTSAAVKIFIEDILSRGRMLDSIVHAFTWPEHPSDDHILNLAIQAGAHYLVTWERRIRGLNTEQNSSAIILRRLAPTLKIVTPKEFAEVLRFVRGTP